MMLHILLIISESTAMTDLTASQRTFAAAAKAPNAALRAIVIGLIAFLTLVDLFATQAVLPALATRYQVMPAAMALAVNACTMGMAIASLLTGLLSPQIDRRLGIFSSLALLAVFTALLASAPNLGVFAGLRIMQGLCMASAFTLTLAHLGEQCSLMEAGGAFAAYITGNVASNLIGRLTSAGLAGAFGLRASFYVFAVLNLAGALLVFLSIRRMPAASMPSPPRSPLGAVGAHWRNRPLRAAFGIGFCILFAFIGAFTFVNFVLVRPPFSLGMMQVGLAYFVFLPSIATTLAAGHVAARVGSRAAIWGALAIAAIGLMLMLSDHLRPVLAGMVLVGIGTFFAQAVATGFVGRAAASDRGIASGVYLACYFAGGIVGSAVLGQVFDRFGWPACVAGIAASLGIAAFLTARLVTPQD